jgi:hypothetical protein
MGITILINPIKPWVGMSHSEDPNGPTRVQEGDGGEKEGGGGEQSVA